MAIDQRAIYQRPVELLQNLIRFDTSNPPGNEEACIRYINGLLSEAGIKTSIYALDPKRPNLIARLKGDGRSPPLLLYGHVDVVTTENQRWKHPPFSGDRAQGYIWGRGALDMKGGVAMMVAAFLRTKVEGVRLPGDIILAVVSDEEKGGQYGARYLVSDHADQFTGVKYGIGEFGGFSFYVGKKIFYLIMVAEKAPLGILMTIRGPTGYPTLSYHGGAMAKLGKALERLDRAHFPVHITPATRLMIETMSSALPFPSNIVLRQLLNPILTDSVLKLLGKQVEQFDPLLHNTVNATSFSWADSPFRVPDRIGVQLACIMLPGCTPEEMLKEVRQIVGDDVDLEINTMFYQGSNSTAVYDPLPVKPDMRLYDTLAGIIRESDPSGIPTPLVLPTATDGRIFCKLGIQTYGFLPMKLPQNYTFWETPHEANERIPIEALTFGTEAIYKLLQRF
jgi:acetylornithine deacetylase/succinyl-diaminopimelate desuccinylase-like protein